jgi:hypothetical protein
MEPSRFCAQCGAQRVDQAHFCEQCGHPFDPPPALAKGAGRSRRRTARKPEGELTWDIGIPLVTNPRMLGTIAKVAALSTLLIVLLMSVFAASQGEWDTILPLAGLFALLGGGVFGLLLFVMLVVLGNRLRTRYRLDSRGIQQETIDKISKTSNRLAVIAGLLGRSPGTTGAGLIAMSQERIALDWKGRFTLEVRPRRHLLIFRNAWRSLLEVYCTAENFDQAQTLARQYMAYHKTAERVAAIAADPHRQRPDSRRTSGDGPGATGTLVDVGFCASDLMAGSTVRLSGPARQCLDADLLH